jgi:muconolactone delta-isomerase
MSLTSFLKKQDVRARFQKEFPSVRFHLPDLPMIPPLSRNYSLMGTAFDYLLRFRLQQHYPHAATKPWVASHAVEMLGCDPRTGDITDEHLEAQDRTQKIIDEAEENLAQYLKTGNMTKDLIRSALLLAQTDYLYRSGQLWEPYGVVDEQDIEDLKKLISAVPIMNFKSQSVCLLNPVFGQSLMVGGADCDLVLDNCMIDIKVVQKLQVKREYIDQLLGYYTLYRLGGVVGMPDGHVIDTLGIYFARHGYQLTFSVSQYVQEATFADFLAWFQKRAKDDYGEVPLR